MVEKIEKYALASNGRGLEFIQDEGGLMIWTVDSFDDATLFDEEKATEIALKILEGAGDFKYAIREEDHPTEIVKVLKLIDVEEIKKLYP